MGTDGACHVDYSKSFNPNIFATELRARGFNFPTFPNGAFFPPGLRHHLFNPFTPRFATYDGGQAVRTKATNQPPFSSP